MKILILHSQSFTSRQRVGKLLEKTEVICQFIDLNHRLPRRNPSLEKDFMEGLLYGDTGGLIGVGTSLVVPGDLPKLHLASWKDEFAIISVEVPVSDYVQESGLDEDTAKKHLYLEREMATRRAFSRDTPLLPLTVAPHLPDSELLGKITPFLASLQSDSTDPTPLEVIPGQEIQCSVYESAPEVVEEMRQWISEKTGIDLSRIKGNWETWIGVYFTPPIDEPPWTPGEFQKIWDVIEENDNVVMRGIPEPNRIGQARSNG